MNKVKGLQESGFEVAIYAQSASDQWGNFEGLREVWGQRVHLAPSVRNVARGVITVMGVAIRQPRGFGRFVRHCWRYRKQNPRGFVRALYTRANFVGQKMDVLHIPFDTQALAYVDLKYYLRCKLVLSSHMPFRESSTAAMFPEALKTLYREADAYYFVSESLRQQAMANGFDASKLHRVITPAIDERVFSPQESKQLHDELRVISVGRLAAQKGYEANLAAVARVRAAGVLIQYVIIGEGALREALEMEVERLGIGDVVEFRGALPPSQVIREMQAADVLLHLARYEGLSSVVLEAQAAGLPVISTRVDGQSEAVEDGIGGFLVEAGDDQGAAEKMLLLAGDADLRRRMGEAGRENILGRFTLERQREAFAELYRLVVGRE